MAAEAQTVSFPLRLPVASASARQHAVFQLSSAHKRRVVRAPRAAPGVRQGAARQGLLLVLVLVLRLRPVPSQVRHRHSRRSSIEAAPGEALPLTVPHRLTRVLELLSDLHDYEVEGGRVSRIDAVEEGGDVGQVLRRLRVVQEEGDDGGAHLLGELSFSAAGSRDVIGFGDADQHSSRRRDAPRHGVKMGFLLPVLLPVRLQPITAEDRAQPFAAQGLDQLPDPALVLLAEGHKQMPPSFCRRTHIPVAHLP
eukprot:633679-Hanusia_phi.AAC.2